MDLHLHARPAVGAGSTFLPVFFCLVKYGRSALTIIPLCLQSAADLRLLHDRQWDWALAVHGSDDAALAASEHLFGTM